MKKTLILAISLAGAAGAYAQGTVNFSTFVSGTLQVAIYAPQTGAAGTAEVTGNSSTDIPSGTTVYTGGTIGGASTGSGSTGYANGANFTAQLYAPVEGPRRRHLLRCRLSANMCPPSSRSAPVPDISVKRLPPMILGLRTHPVPLRRWQSLPGTVVVGH